MFGEVSRNRNEIVKFLQTDYSDIALYKLLKAAENNEIWFFGVSYCLVGRSDAGYRACDKRTDVAELAYRRFEIHSGLFSFGRTCANRRMVSIIKQEMKRREEGRKLTEDLVGGSGTVEDTPELRVGQLVVSKIKAVDKTEAVVK